MNNTKAAVDKRVSLLLSRIKDENEVRFLENVIVCLIIIVNIVFSGYFKYYFTYDHFFFTMRSPIHAVLPDPKLS